MKTLTITKKGNEYWYSGSHFPPQYGGKSKEEALKSAKARGFYSEGDSVEYKD